MRFLTPFLLLVVLLSGAAQAQETTAAWEVTVYIPDESAIVTLSAAGEIERLPVPEQVTEILKHTFDPVIRLSADHHWLAFNQEIDSGVVYLSDLQAGSCCVEFGAETALPDGTMPGVFQLVGFSPDGTKLALVAEHYPMECGEYCFPDTSGILVELDTMTLQVVGDFVSSGSRPVGWVDGGIASTQVVYCLPGEMCVRSTVVSVQVVRDVKAGEIVSSIPIGVSNYAYDRGDHLYSSGEYITPYVY
ncbi:MAG: hypothetical protein K8I82_08230, partial [Anaerolineae bacterium]|nr:hypothetical protein [Anaerolineae bacterium]